MFPKNRFYFIRHGETEWNRTGRYMGQKDIPLNETGKIQAQEMRGLVHTLEIATLCVSPLARTRQTAEILNQDWNKPIQLIDDLKEVAWGIHEGEWQDDGSRFEKWIQGLFYPQGGESLKGFVTRVQNGISQALQGEGPVLIVSHGGVFYALQILLKLPLDFALSNCELMVVENTSNMWLAKPIQ